jgi:hypothetical protein
MDMGQGLAKLRKEWDMQVYIIICAGEGHIFVELMVNG